jgi:hypothetical protein
LVILAKHQRAWWWLVLLVILFSASVCEAAPNLVGTWQGMAPAMSTACFTQKITISITRQCGNLFQGRATVAGTTINFVGSIKGGSSVNIHGQSGVKNINIMGNYQAGSPAKINVTYINTSGPQTEYDTFPANYAGHVQNSAVGAFDLLLLGQ